MEEEQGEGRDWWTSQWGGVCAPWLAKENRSWWLCFCLSKSLKFRLLGRVSASRAFCMYTQTCVGVKVLSTFHTETVPIKYSSEEDSHLYILYYSALEIFQWLSCCLQDLDTRDKTGGSLIFYIWDFCFIKILLKISPNDRSLALTLPPRKKQLRAASRWSHSRGIPAISPSAVGGGCR